MNDSLTVTTERVDDIPILLNQMDHMGLVDLVNEHCAPHGTWQGVSPGQLICGWIGYALSEADHRLNQVQAWAKRRLQTLRSCLGETVVAQDFTDDRLAIQLDALGDDASLAQQEVDPFSRTSRQCVIDVCNRRKAIILLNLMHNPVPNGVVLVMNAHLCLRILSSPA